MAGDARGANEGLIRATNNHSAFARGVPCNPASLEAGFFFGDLCVRLYTDLHRDIEQLSCLCKKLEKMLLRARQVSANNRALPTPVFHPDCRAITVGCRVSE